MIDAVDSGRSPAGTRFRGSVNRALIGDSDQGTNTNAAIARGANAEVALARTKASGQWSVELVSLTVNGVAMALPGGPALSGSLVPSLSGPTDADAVKINGRVMTSFGAYVNLPGGSLVQFLVTGLPTVGATDRASPATPAAGAARPPAATGVASAQPDKPLTGYWTCRSYPGTATTVYVNHVFEATGTQKEIDEAFKELLRTKFGWTTGGGCGMAIESPGILEKIRTDDDRAVAQLRQQRKTVVETTWAWRSSR
jgi:hypothetical protein